MTKHTEGEFDGLEAENDRLRAVNDELVAALDAVAFAEMDIRAIRRIARAAIAKATNGA